MHNTEKLRKLLEVVRDEILPLTASEVARGNQTSGAAILRPETMTSVMVGSDNRVENPLFHGQIDTLIRFFKLPVHPPAEELIFLTTHDPCPMCASAIAWAGFREVWVLFDCKNNDDAPAEEVSADAAMYRELFGVDNIRGDNAYFKKYNLKKAVSTSPDREELQEILEEIERRYDEFYARNAEYPGV